MQGYCEQVLAGNSRDSAVLHQDPRFMLHQSMLLHTEFQPRLEV